MKRIGTGLLIFFFCVIIGTLSGDSKEKKDEMTHLVVAIPFFRVPKKDVKMVEKQVDAIARRKIGVSVEFKAYSNYDKEVNLLLTTNSQLDIAVTSDENYLDYYLEGQLCPLDSYLEKQGSGIVEQLGEKVIHCCNINNTLYGIPSYHDYAADYNSYILRKDILDQYQIDPSKIKTIEDLEEVFALVKQGEPDMTILVPGFGTILSHQYYLDGGFRVGGHMDYGREEELVNIFETQEYRKDLKRVRNWYLKGYLDPNPLGRTRSVLDRMARGEIFAYTTKGKPGILSQDSSEKGMELVCVNLGKTAISHNTIAGREYVITRNTVSIEKSMELLNLMYTDSDIMNLLSYGVEGIHYKKLEDGHTCWLMLINNGLRDKGSVEALANGGYSGRYQFGKGAWGPIDKDPKNSKGESINYWSPINDIYTFADGSTKSFSSEWQWVSSIMNDFAARADWCITSDYSKANHAPSISIKEGIDFTAEAGKTLKLHAITSDPDNDYVSVNWANYGDASTYTGTETVVIKEADSDTARIVIPADAKSGDKIYVNVKAQDDGEHSLVHYQQVIITVK